MDIYAQKNRTMMKNGSILTGIMFTGALLPVAGLNAQQRKDNARPNLIIVMTDDQGMGDLGCMGNDHVITPNIDKFYENAVRLTNYHVSTTSAPSRAALMTGRHTNRLNCFHTIMGRSLLFEDEEIMPQVFGQNGYVSGMFGKWHLGDNYPFRPEDRGFNEVVRHGGGGMAHGADYWGNDYFDDTYFHNSVPEKYKGYCTDVFFDEALKFIEENKDRPFFCYITPNAPHLPFNVPEEYLDKYKNVKCANEKNMRFDAMVTNIDDNFGRLRKKLKELGIEDNTILVFTTDNGNASFDTYNAGMRGMKGSPYEGGHRVPFFICWPDGQVTGGKDVDRLLAHYDVLPTMVELMGLKHNPQKTLDGKSFKSLLYNKDAEWENRILYIDTQREKDLVKYKNYAVMDDNWRLVRGKELYDMRKDRAQQHNVIDQFPEVAARLAVGYEKWWSSILSEGVDERYAYIKVGTPYENPSRISAHDMLVGRSKGAWCHNGVSYALQPTGIYKLQFMKTGKYRISVCRFPLESGLEINATFPRQKPERRLQHTAPGSTKNDFVAATLELADISKKIEIKPGDREVVFTEFIPEGKFDVEAKLIDSKNIEYPGYFIYVEKLED